MEKSEYVDMQIVHMIDMGRTWFYIKQDPQKRWIMTEYRKTVEGKPFVRQYYCINECDPFQ